MKTIVSLLLALAGAASVFGQATFQKEFSINGNAEVQTVLQTDDGGYALLANRVEATQTKKDLWLIRTNNNGDTLWTRTYTGPFDTYSGDRTLVQSADGGFMILVCRNYYTYLLHISSTGDSLWRKAIYAGRALSLARVSGDQYIASVFRPDSSFAILMNAEGALVWKKCISTHISGMNNGVRGWSVREAQDGGYVIAGAFEDSYMQERSILLRLGTDGDSLWFRIYYHSNLADWTFLSVDTIHGGGFYTAGMIHGNSDAIVMRFTDTGDTLWSRTFRGPKDQGFYSIRSTTDGGVVACGWFEDSAQHIWLKKYDGTGNIVWDRKFEDAYDAYGLCVDQAADGGFMLGGSKQPLSGSQIRGIFLKTTSEGTISGLSDPDGVAGFSLSPNPARAFVRLSRVQGSAINAGELLLIDILGHCVRSFPLSPGETEKTMEISGLPEGVYIARIVSAGGVMNTQKLVIRSDK